MKFTFTKGFANCYLEKSQQDNTCITSQVRPFFKEFSDPLNHTHSTWPKKAKCDEVSFDFRNATLWQSGWLLCSQNSSVFPSVLLTRLAIKRFPEFVEVTSGKQKRHTFLVNITLASLEKLNLTWTYIRRQVGMSLELWDILPNSKELTKRPRFIVKHHEKSIQEGFLVTKLTAKFPDPNIRCTGGNYIIKACNSLGCDSRNFTVESSGRPCATLNSTFLVKKRYFVPEITEKNISIHKLHPKDPSKPSDAKYTKDRIVYALVLCLLSLAGALVMICVFFAYWTLRRRDQTARSSQLKIMHDFEKWKATDKEDEVLMEENTSYVSWLIALKQKCMIVVIPSEEINICRQLGEGAFGCVYLVQQTSNTIEANKRRRTSKLSLNVSPNTLPSPNHGARNSLMAMKTLKFLSAEKLKDLEREAGLLTQIDHPNIVKFYGITLKGSCGFALLFEYMEEGDLAHYLRNRNPDFSSEGDPSVGEALKYLDLLHLAVQVASGLEYLAGRHLVHRDLAARNCLVGKNRIVKLSDFGMTRDLYVSDYYKMDSHTLIPLRWLPPESVLYRKFTTESDVWSLGVLLWEIFSYGEVPWCAYSNCEVLKIVKAGQVLGKPDHCPDVVYDELILKCCSIQPNQRLTASVAKSVLQSLLNKALKADSNCRTSKNETIPLIHEEHC